VAKAKEQRIIPVVLFDDDDDNEQRLAKDFAVFV